MTVNLTLETMALAKYGTMEAYDEAAEACGLNRKRARRILDPAASLRITEFSKLVKLLEIPSYLTDMLFFGAIYIPDAMKEANP